MKIELKNIKHSPSLSEETEAYTATLYVDGKKLGFIKNSGQGGSDEFHGDWKCYEKVNIWCKDNLPQWSFSDELHDTDLEMLCHEILGDHLLMKELKTLMRKAVVILKEDKIFNITWPKTRKVDQRHIDHVAKDHKVILNSLPIEEAFELYKHNA